MSHDTLSTDEREKLLSMMPADLVNTIDARATEGYTPELVTVQELDDALQRAVHEDVDALEKLAQEFLAKAKGNLDTAKQLSEKWAKAEFDKVKLSKIDAARLGVDKAAHNSSEYRRIQSDRERINTIMRKAKRGHVREKITAAKQANPDMDALLLQYADHPLAQAIAAAHKEG